MPKRRGKHRSAFNQRRRNRLRSQRKRLIAAAQEMQGYSDHQIDVFQAMAKNSPGRLPPEKLAIWFCAVGDVQEHNWIPEPREWVRRYFGIVFSPDGLKEVVKYLEAKPWLKRQAQRSSPKPA